MNILLARFWVDFLSKLKQKTVEGSIVNSKLSYGVIVLVILALGGVYIGSAASVAQTEIEHEIIFSIPVGDTGIHYEGDENPDMLTWGPPAFTVAPDGTFWIADTPDNHILHFDVDGVLLDKIDVGKFVVGAGNIEVTDNEIWILDMASIPPKLVRMSIKGDMLQFYDLPEGLHPEDGLSGIALGSSDSIFIEFEGGAKVVQFEPSDGEIKQKTVDTLILRNHSRFLFDSATRQHFYS